MPNVENVCQLCGRQVDAVTTHHLIPRTRHKNKKNKRDFSRTEVRERAISVCRPCHKNIHAVLTNKQLERDYNTLELLKIHPDIEKFSRWISDKPSGMHVGVRRKSDGD